MGTDEELRSCSWRNRASGKAQETKRNRLHTPSSFEAQLSSHSSDLPTLIQASQGILFAFPPEDPQFCDASLPSLSHSSTSRNIGT